MIIDTGFFVPLAERLAKEAEVYYFCSWENGYPKFKDYCVGMGLDGVTKVDTIGEVLQMIDEIDLWIFPDCYYGSLAKWLRDEGCLVWGMAETTWMEQDRYRLKEWMESEKMPLPEWGVSTGITELKENIEDDRFIKISKFRGDMETLKNYSPEMSEQFYDELSVKLGGGKELMEFIDEEKVEGSEWGTDMWTVNGEYPKYGIAGVEIKDQVYTGKVFLTSLMPKPLTYVNEKLSKVFKQEQARGFVSTEVRIDKNMNPFVIDLTLRLPNPPYQAYLTMIDNLLEVMYEGAKGNLVEPKFNSKYVAIAIMESEFAENNWMPIDIPKNVKDWTMIMCSCKIDGVTYALPIYGLSEIGAVVGTGETLDEAVENCKKHAEKIKGYKLSIETLSFDEAKQTIDKGRKYGILF